jgi:hypothetical protein
LPLEFDQSGVGTPLLEQFLVVTRLKNLSFVQDQNFMGFLDG